MFFALWNLYVQYLKMTDDFSSLFFSGYIYFSDIRLLLG